VGARAQGTRASPGAALSQELGTRAAWTRGAPGATLCSAGTGAAGTRGAPGAALRREAGGGAGLGAAPSREAGPDTQHPRGCPEPIYCWLFLVISS
jgi:hypothetical protein